MAVPKVSRRSVADEISGLLDSPEIVALITELEAARWTGRKGYPIRSLVGAGLVKSLYAISTWSRTAALISEHSALQDALGGTPSVYAMYRFATKLRENRPALDACFVALAASLQAELPKYGQDVAMDGSDLPAFANGQRYLSNGGKLRERYSDPDASWGHRSAISTRKGGGFYGYKIHAVVCATTGLPLAWEVTTAKRQEITQVVPLLDRIAATGFAPETCSLDKGYDQRVVYTELEDRGIHPVIPLRLTPDVERIGERPMCSHGEWTFAGADFKNKRTKWRCPTGECEPRSAWVKADRLHPLIPRNTKRYRELRTGRAAVEREFGRLKHEYGLAPLRVRGIEKVALHADLCILARLAQALARARVRSVPLAA